MDILILHFAVFIMGVVFSCLIFMACFMPVVRYINMLCIAFTIFFRKKVFICIHLLRHCIFWFRYELLTTILCTGRRGGQGGE